MNVAAGLLDSLGIERKHFQIHFDRDETSDSDLPAFEHEELGDLLICDDSFGCKPLKLPMIKFLLPGLSGHSSER